jgi:hypothetical protein
MTRKKHPLLNESDEVPECILTLLERKSQEREKYRALKWKKLKESHKSFYWVPNSWCM